ncbi:MAG: hypothetical protein ACKO7P_05705 [Bacteroidota bacterium]
MKNILRVILFLFPLTAFTQSTIAPKYSNEFLSLGVGADAFGMGNAVVAGIDNMNAIYWNPAGLTQCNKWLEVSFMHSEYFAGIAKYDFLGISHSIDESSTLGFAAIRFGVDDIPNTTQLIDNNGRVNYDNVSSFTAGDYAFLTSYARKLKVSGMSLGGTMKVIYRNVGDFAKSWGFGLDAGWQYQLKKNWKFGVMARDVTSTFNAWVFELDDETKNVFLSTGNAIPVNGLELTLPRVILAAAGKFDLGSKGFHAGGELDVDLTSDGKRNVLLKSDLVSADPHAGFFVGFKDFVKIRGGISGIQQFTNMDETKYWGFQPNLGMGLGFKGFSLDYAFTRLGDASANYYTHIFSLRLKLDKPKNAVK